MLHSRNRSLPPGSKKLCRNTSSMLAGLRDASAWRHLFLENRKRTRTRHATLLKDVESESEHFNNKSVERVSYAIPQKCHSRSPPKRIKKEESIRYEMSGVWVPDPTPIVGAPSQPSRIKPEHFKNRFGHKKGVGHQSARSAAAAHSALSGLSRTVPSSNCTLPL